MRNDMDADVETDSKIGTETDARTGVPTSAERGPADYDVAKSEPASPNPSSATMVLIDWMVFDLGNVVLYQNDALPELARRLGADPALSADAFRAAYSAPRYDYDLHSDATRYWSAVAAACGAPRPDARAVAELTEIDVAIWSRTDPKIIDLFGELHGAGIRLAVLSNAPTAMGDHVRRQPWARYFENIVISGEIGLIKPNAAIYRYLLTRLASPADRVAFADDLADNIAGAKSVGIRGILFRGPTTLRAQLALWGVPLGR